MSRVSQFLHHGRPVVQIDFSNLDAAGIPPVIAEAEAVIRAAPAKSLATITQVNGASFTTETIAALKEFARANEPHVGEAVIVGLSGLQRIVLSAVAHVSGRPFVTCDTVEEAKARLAADGGH